MDYKHSRAAAVVRDLLTEVAQCQMIGFVYHIPFEGKSMEDLLCIYRERCDLYDIDFERSECVQFITKLVTDGTLVQVPGLETALYRFPWEGAELESRMARLRSLPRDVGIIRLVIDHNGIKPFRDTHAKALTPRDKHDLKRIEKSLGARIGDPCYSEKRYIDHLGAFFGARDVRRVRLVSDDHDDDFSTDGTSTTLKSKKRKTHTSYRNRKGRRVDYSPGAQLRTHIDREVTGKLKQAAFNKLLKELTDPADSTDSRKWEAYDCPPWECPKVKTKCNCKQGGGNGKASLISCTLFRDFMGWPTDREQHECLFKKYKQLFLDGDSTLQ